MTKRKHVHVTPSKRFHCSFKITPTQVCGERFSNIYLLRKHRKTMGHQRKQKNRSQAVAPDIEQYVSRVKRAIAAGTARETGIEKEGGEGGGEMESVVEGGDEGDGEIESVAQEGDDGDSAKDCVDLLKKMMRKTKYGLSVQNVCNGCTSRAYLHTILMMQMMTIFCVQTALQRSLNGCLHCLIKCVN